MAAILVPGSLREQVAVCMLSPNFSTHGLSKIMCPGDCKSELSATPAVPLRVLAKDTRGAIEQVLYGLGAPSRVSTEAGAPARGDQDLLAARLKKDLATAPPDRTVMSAMVSR